MSFLLGSTSHYIGSFLWLCPAMKEVPLHFRPNNHRTTRTSVLQIVWQIEVWCPDLGLCPWNSQYDSHRLAPSPVPTKGDVRWSQVNLKYSPTSFIVLWFIALCRDYVFLQDEDLWQSRVFCSSCVTFW